MQFTSPLFLVSLPLVVLAYWSIRDGCARLLLLLVASLVFYAHHHWPALLLLCFSIVFNYFFSKVLAKSISLRLLTVGIIVNMVPLLYFKYVGVFCQAVNEVAVHLGGAITIPVPPQYLPLGISFFTFQVVAYLVDVYRKEISPEPSLLRFALFKSFFPQLIAGPIVRAREFLPQLQGKVPFDPARFHQAIWLVVSGLTLKVCVADFFGQFANEAFASVGKLSVGGAWAGLYSYSIQLFADFWGYSTIAVGLAALFGLKLPHNFETPYYSQSLKEFWRRWHITLSVWLKDYLYIPLGGNRRKAYRNLLITMLAAGAWHGAGLTFILWGGLHGAWLALERFLPEIPLLNTRPARLFRVIAVFHGVTVLWILFRAPSVQDAMDYARNLLPHDSEGEGSLRFSSGLLLRFAVFAFLQAPLASTMKGERFTSFPMPLQLILVLLCILCTIAYSGAQINFIYFSF
jgi:alginate O-acetyltransferase complex protein AlgI